MKMNWMVKTLALLMLGVLLASCAGSATQPAQAPAVDVAATMNVVQTQAADALKAVQDNAAATLTAVQNQTVATLDAVQAGAVATVGAQVMQTMAAIPTATPYPTPTAAATLPAVPPTATPLPTHVTPVTPPGAYPTVPASGYSCRILSQSPDSNPKMDAGYDFDQTWVIKNSGSKTWSLGEVDYRFSNGTKFQKYADVFDIPQTVNPGGEVTLTVDMKAPAASGYYVASWVLVKGNTVICYLTTELTVK